MKIDGKEYKNLNEYCKKTGKNYHTIWGRIKTYGMTIDEAVRKSFEVEYKGKKYANLKELCRKQKVNYLTVRARMVNHGLSLEEAISVKRYEIRKVENYKNNFDFNGKHYKSITDYCNGDEKKQRKLLKIRKENNCDMVKAIDIMLNPPPKPKTIKQLCREMGISRQLYYTYLNNGRIDELKRKYQCKD